MSSTEWIGASQVIRSRCGSRIGRVSSLTSGSSSQASGNASTSFAYSSGIGADVDRRVLVVALQVERVDRAGLGELLDQGVAPGVGGVELEARAGVALEHAQHALGGLRLVAVERAEPHRHDVGERPQLAPEVLPERRAGLAQREVERGGLERPAPVAARHVAHRRVREQVELGEALGERPERVRAGERQRRPRGLEALMVEPVVDHVLADTLLTAAAQRDDRGVADELLGEGELAPLELVAVDFERKRCELVPGTHGRRD